MIFLKGGEIMKSIKPIYVLILVIVFAAGGFYGGMQYQKSQRASFAMGAYGAAGGQFGRRAGGMGGNFQAGGSAQAMRPVSGEIVSQDSKSVTVKMADGSSKIVNLSDQTKINKASTGSMADLKSGTKVSVFGTTNSDGSVTAQMVSIGGNMMFRGGGGAAPSQDK